MEKGRRRLNWVKPVRNTLFLAGVIVATHYITKCSADNKQAGEAPQSIEQVMVSAPVDSTTVDSLALDSLALGGDYIHVHDNHAPVYINSIPCCPEQDGIEERVVVDKPASSKPQAKYTKQPVVDSAAIKKYDRLLEIHNELLRENDELYKQNKQYELQEESSANPFCNVGIDIHRSKEIFAPDSCDYDNK